MSCSALHHRDCWQSNKGCAVVGCGGAGIVETTNIPVARAATPSRVDEDGAGSVPPVLRVTSFSAIGVVLTAAGLMASLYGLWFLPAFKENGAVIANNTIWGQASGLAFFSLFLLFLITLNIWALRSIRSHHYAFTAFCAAAVLLLGTIGFWAYYRNKLPFLGDTSDSGAFIVAEVRHVGTAWIWLIGSSLATLIGLGVTTWFSDTVEDKAATNARREKWAQDRREERAKARALAQRRERLNLQYAQNAREQRERRARAQRGGTPTPIKATPREIKRCPQCAEDVWVEAVICRYCQHQFS